MKEIKSLMPDGGDSGIKVEITDDEILQCFRVTLYGREFNLHARTLFDLHTRIGTAILEWNIEAGMNMINLIEGNYKNG